MLGLDAPTSALLLRLLLLGLTRTSLKSSLRSASTRGISLGVGARGCPGGGGGGSGGPAVLAAPPRPQSRAEPSRAAPAKARRPRTERIYRARAPGPIALLGEGCF